MTANNIIVDEHVIEDHVNEIIEDATVSVGLEIIVNRTLLRKIK